MEAVVNHVNRRFNLTRPDILDGDPRVDDWLFMNNLESVVALVILYLLMVKFGPGLMEKREAFSLTHLLVAYNFGLVALSVFTFYEMVACYVQVFENFLCHPINYERTEIGFRETGAAWWYFFSKVIELMDTFYSGSINCLVHVFMYTYYGVAAMGPHMQKYLWWKRYMTQFQLFQFVFVNGRCFISFFSGPCEYPRWANAVAMLYSSSLLLLFLNFYSKSYRSQPVKAKLG